MQRPERAKIVEACCAFKKNWIVCRNRAPFARCNRFVELQAIYPNISDRSDRSAFIARPQTLGTVFDYAKLMLAGDWQNAVEIGRTTLQMHRHNGLSLRRNAMFDIRRINVERLVDLGEDRKAASKNNGAIAGMPGPGREDHLVARADFESIDSAL